MEMDVCWKEYFRDEARYADVINGLGCAGQQLVKGEDLQEADTQTLLGRWYRTLGKGEKVHACIWNVPKRNFGNMWKKQTYGK